MKTLLVIIIALAIIAGGVYAYRLGTAPSNGSQAQACTMEARLCPDGSYVGRTGPNCEFTACPSSTISGSTISTSTQNGLNSTTTTTVKINY